MSVKSLFKRRSALFQLICGFLQRVFRFLYDTSPHDLRPRLRHLAHYTLHCRWSSPPQSKCRPTTLDDKSSLREPVFSNRRSFNLRQRDSEMKRIVMDHWEITTRASGTSRAHPCRDPTEDNIERASKTCAHYMSMSLRFCMYIILCLSNIEPLVNVIKKNNCVATNHHATITFLLFFKMQVSWTNCSRAKSPVQRMESTYHCSCQ